MIIAVIYTTFAVTKKPEKTLNTVKVLISDHLGKIFQKSGHN